MSSAPSIPAKRALPAKEATLFKELLSQYEAHQIKKAQKTADQILKKFPEHGETLAMKGLVVFQSGKKDEGLDLIRKGIKYDLTSHIVWHVFGLAKKSEKDYEEAVKSYQQALRYEKDNVNILRDAGNLYMQLRQYDALEGVRLTMLRIRPNVRQNWLAMAVSYHLNGNLRSARDVLETYESMLKNIPEHDTEHSELLLYHVKVLELSGDFNLALDFLETNAKMHRIIDPLAIVEGRARLLSKVGKHEQANTRWLEMLELNPDCREYYAGYLENCGITLEALTDENRLSCLHHLKELANRYRSSTMAMRLALSVASGDEFRELVTNYITNAIGKGVPSLFVDLKALLANKERSKIIREVINGIHSATQDDDPIMYLWSTYFLIQHLSHEGDHANALHWWETLAEHTPTLPEVYSLKAKVLKRVGDLDGASEAMEQARLLDGQDRFLNWKSAKYLLRAGKFSEAQKVLGLFTKKDAPTPSHDLEDMQCLDYLLEEGDAYRRLHNPGMALKRYTTVHKVFSDVEDDQFDFHSYALRKSSINPYFDMIMWEDRLRANPAYVRSAVAAAKVYMELYDVPKDESSGLDGERKNAKKKAKKPAAKIAEGTTLIETNSSATPSKDDDPEGHKLATTNDPLEQAYNLLKPLEAETISDLEVLGALFDVGLRRNKYLQALRLLRRVHSLGSDDPEFHLRTIQFLHICKHSEIDETTRNAIAKELTKMQIDEDTPLAAYNQAYLQRHSHLASAIWASFRADQILGTVSRSSDDIVTFLLRPEVVPDLSTSSNVLSYLLKYSSPLIGKFKEHSQHHFPLCPIFRSEPGKPETANLPNGHATSNLDVSHDRNKYLLGQEEEIY